MHAGCHLTPVLVLPMFADFQSGRACELVGGKFQHVYAASKAHDNILLFNCIGVRMVIDSCETPVIICIKHSSTVLFEFRHMEQAPGRHTMLLMGGPTTTTQAQEPRNGRLLQGLHESEHGTVPLTVELNLDSRLHMLQDPTAPSRHSSA